MKIAMVMSEWACARPISPKELFTSPRGLTGSEISFHMMSRGLKKMGHDVTIFSNFTSNETVDDIQHVRFEHFQDRMSETWDAVAAWIDPAPLKLVKLGTTRLFNQQVNDFYYCAGWENYVDIITSPSDSHRKYLKGHTTYSGRWEILANGTDVQKYSMKNRREDCSKKLIYASSPDRGLHWILEAFPEIKRRVPQVTLDVFYDWQTFYNNVRHGSSETSYRLRYCKEMFDRLRAHGVTHHGSASRDRMIEVFHSSRLLAYPCDTVSYTEGFSVTTLEAALSDCVPVLVDTDALGEVYRGYVPVVSGPYRENKREYIETVIELLDNDAMYERWQSSASRLSRLYSWDVLCRMLSEFLT